MLKMLPKRLSKVSVKAINGRTLDGWTRARAEEDLLYYLNHDHNITQWDHPEYIRTFDELLSINSIRYAAYRMACKLRYLQTRFRFHEVTLQCVSSAFDCAGFKAAENFDIVSAKDIERVVLYVFRSTYKGKSVDVSLFTDLMMNVILNTFDENRSGNLLVLKCKVLLVVFCGGRLQEKYRYLFNQIADHNNCCTRRRLAKLLHCFSSISELLSEQLSFGISLIPPAVDSCFKEVEGEIGVTEDVFLDWLMRQPQVLVWWTTLYRMSAAESVRHDIKCGVCKQRPMVGLRYQCLKCFAFNMCQNCFLSGRKSRGHKLSHPIQEYCRESTIKEWRQSIFKIFRHRLIKSNTSKPHYLTLSPGSGRTLESLLHETSLRTPLNTELFNSQHKPNAEDNPDIDKALQSRTICQSIDQLDCIEACEDDLDLSDGPDDQKTPLEEPIFCPSPRYQIHSVIKQLEDDQKQLSNCLDSNDSKPLNIPCELLEEHNAKLQTQIGKLKKILMNYTLQSKNAKNKRLALPRMESTPIVGERGLHLSLSPIAMQGRPMNDSAILDNKENHFVETQFHQGEKGRCMNNERFVVLPSLSENRIPSTMNKQGIPRSTKVNRNIAYTDMNWSELDSLASNLESKFAASYDEQQEVADIVNNVADSSSKIAGFVNNIVSNNVENADDRANKLAFAESSKNIEDIVVENTADSSKNVADSSNKVADIRNDPAFSKSSNNFADLDNKDVTTEDRTILEVKEELQNLLFLLDDVFPQDQSAKEDSKCSNDCDAFAAVRKIGDAMSNYVDTVPVYGVLCEKL